MSKPKQKKTRKNKAYLYKSSDASFIEPPQTTTIYAKLAHIGGILVFLWIGWHAVKWIGGELYEWHLRDAYSRIEVFSQSQTSRIICLERGMVYVGDGFCAELENKNSR